MHCYNLIIVGISFSVCIRFNLSSSVNECHQQEALLCIFDRQCEEGKKMSMYIPWRWFHFRMAAIFMYACEIGIKNTKKKAQKIKIARCFQFASYAYLCVCFFFARTWVSHITNTKPNMHSNIRFQFISFLPRTQQFQAYKISVMRSKETDEQRRIDKSRYKTSSKRLKGYRNTCIYSQFHRSFLFSLRQKNCL